MPDSLLRRIPGSAIGVAVWAVGALLAAPVAAQQVTTVRVGTLLDGAGAVRRNVVVTVRGTRIAGIAPGTGRPAATYDLSQLTVLPGLIDTHVHLDSHFGKDGRASNVGETPADRSRAAEENAYTTLMAGYTTVQSLGAEGDLVLRDAIASGRIRGPRVLTSAAQLTDTSLTPDQIRAWVSATVAKGADVIKIFASRSIRDGGGQTLSAEQIRAACTEARAQGKRSWVHAHAASAVRDAANAGCFAVTHGSQVTDAELHLMAERGTYFEPNIGLVSQNYLEHKANYLGIGNYTEDGFQLMEAGIPRKLEMFKRAMRTPGLRILAGTDATAGAHGQNAREVVYRVDHAGQAPAQALASVTSGAAPALGLGGRIGTLKAGMEADLIGVDGDPLTDMTALQRVVFVMKGGAVVRNVPPRFEATQPELFAAGANLTNAWADYDGDGSQDLFVGFNGTPNRLYRNTGGVFADVAPAAGVADPRATRAAAWGDFDADGDPDLMIGYAPGAGSVLRLYRNDHGRFTDITRHAGLARDSAAVRQLSWIDLDGDGDLDLFVALRDRPNAMYRNDGGHFVDIAADIGLADPRNSVGAVWADFDGDGDLDLYVANQDGDANGLFRNTGGRFADVAATAGVAWGGRMRGDAGNGTVRPCAADVDGDGRFDLFAANYGRNGLFLNRGERFDDASSAWGVAIDARYDACAFADYDNDGRLDLYVNGTVTGGVSYRDYLFHNGGHRFEDVTPDKLRVLQADHGAEWADYDEDGAIDLALAGSRADGMHFLFRNQRPAASSAKALSVRVLDANGHATLAGAEVRAYVAGTRRLIALRLVDTGSGYNAQNDAPVHVGIGSATRVDVEVTYPRAGTREVTTVRDVRAVDRRTALTVRVPARR